ncbi:MAG TPA: MATE family efflux transporter [Rhizomicrobium sp.]|nr:MATE family efflux transporter [Rhizomicrobium sp.]
MRDLTAGSIGGHLLRMALPIMAGMVFQTAYFLVDLYFVAHIGPSALAGVSAAGNVVMLVLALTMMLAAGTLALLSHAVGRKDRQESNLVFNQANALGALLTVLTLAVFYPLAPFYMAQIGAGSATAEAGRVYLYFYIPGLAMQFLMTALSSSLRATGIVQPTMLISMASLTINIILAPVLIAGWGTGHPLGVAGAGLASSIAVGAGAVMLVFYFARYEHYVAIGFAEWRPRWAIWKRLFLIGIPAGGEFALMVVYTSIIYWAIRSFGTEAQAGYGAGSRVMQAIFMPGFALSFAAAPIAGQNFGAKNWERVRATFRTAIVASTAVMIVLMLICQWRPDALIRVFSNDPRVVVQGAEFLRIISWNFIGAGIIYSCSGMFQALGNTWPALVSSGSRFLTLALPVVLLSLQPGFRIEWVWYVSVGSVILQAGFSLLLLLREFRLRLPLPQSTAQPAAA